MTVETHPTWRNWAGNQSFGFRQRVSASSTEEVARAVAREAQRGGTVRAAGSGHSFMPVVETSGTLLDLSGLTGLVSVDADARRAWVRAGTELGAIGAPLWEHGLAIANQGDIDRQTLAGAVSTGTKGSGTRFGTMSSTITGLELVDGRGDVVRIDGTDPDALHAAQVSLGLLGVLTQIEIELVPAYSLREQNLVMHVDELLERWDQLKADYRHFSFWWMPTEASAKVYELPAVPADHAFVKLLSEEPASEVTLQGEDGARLGRAHLVYPDIELGDPFFELEYVVDAAHDRDAFLEVRRLMLEDHPEQASPVQVRWQRADEGFLSPQYQRDSVSVSVSGVPGTVWEPFLREVDALLDARDARPHWGKVHFLTPERARRVYPRLDDFQRLRERFDPERVFLNDHLAEVVVDA